MYFMASVMHMHFDAEPMVMLTRQVLLVPVLLVSAAEDAFKLMSGDRGFQPEEREPSKLHEMLAGEVMCCMQQAQATPAASALCKFDTQHHA
jgi:hypothetical protein